MDRAYERRTKEERVLMDKMLKTLGGIGLILGIGFVALKLTKEFSRKRRVEKLLEEYED